MREVPINLGGKVRKLRYDFNALCDLERALGRPMFDVISGLPRLPFADIRDLLWTGVQHERDAQASVRQVGDWMVDEIRAGRAKLADFWLAIDRALAQSGVFGDPDEVEKKKVEGDSGNAEASQTS